METNTAQHDADQAQSPPEYGPTFVAINTIHCKPGYVSRFEELFCSRARAIDRVPGFMQMKVLKPRADGEPYLVVSEWKDEESFTKWVGSPEFHEGHRRAFEDLAEAKRRGEEPPMRSDFGTFDILTS